MSYHSSLGGNSKREKIMKDEKIEMPTLINDKDQAHITIDNGNANIYR